MPVEFSECLEYSEESVKTIHDYLLHIGYPVVAMPVYAARTKEMTMPCKGKGKKKGKGKGGKK
jgi:hypothetical protein